MTELVRVRAPASTANLGPGFDCAAAALDLWNELVVTEGGEPDPAHLGIRAYGLVADPSGLAFDFSLDIPRERGLGSSASIIALGMAAATFLNGGELDPERLLARGMPLEGHADNLAAVLAGGVCLTWDGHIARDRRDAAVRGGRGRAEVARADGRSARVAAATRSHTVPQRLRSRTRRCSARGSRRTTPSCSPPRLHDELHEPYRAPFAPALDAVRADLPTGAVGATISGSGPTVIVWTHAEQVDACTQRARVPVRRREHPAAERLADGSPPCLTRRSSSSTSTTRCSTTTPSPPTCART